MEGSPGSMSAYSQSGRDWLIPKEGPGPGEYDVKIDTIVPREETVAPFDTSSTRDKLKQSTEGHCIYYPFKRDLRQSGSPLFRWASRFPSENNFSCAQNIGGRLPDPWVQKTQAILDLNTKRPRVPYDKYVSNNVPTISHPLDNRCFVIGIDGRMYPWKISRKNKTPGPKYDTFKVFTSQSKLPSKINFVGMSARKDLFPLKDGAGPADFVVRRFLPPEGGIFMSEKWDNPDSSSPRMFEVMEKQLKKENFPSPSDCVLPGSFDKLSPKAVSAPFRSRTALGLIKAQPGPGPGAHFDFNKMQEHDLKKRLKPGIITFPPPKAPFETSQERFADPSELEQLYLPSSAEYDIPSFTEEMKLNMERHPAAIPNPKLGFLTSAEARPVRKDNGDLNLVTRSSEPPRKWRNLRPKKGQTYGYNGAPPKYPDSPGPIYDANPGITACKGKKSWWDPRAQTRTGFGNSGCERKPQCFNFDKDIPSPGIYYAKLASCCKPLGRRSTPGPRFLESSQVNPGPVHKLHQKCESSMWRASHLGTHNSFLKRVGVLFPWAGGFRKRNLTTAGDEAWHINREDDYAEALCSGDQRIPLTGRTPTLPHKV